MWFSISSLLFLLRRVPCRLDVRRQALDEVPRVVCEVTLYAHCTVAEEYGIVHGTLSVGKEGQHEVNREFGGLRIGLILS